VGWDAWLKERAEREGVAEVDARAVVLLLRCWRCGGRLGGCGIVIGAAAREDAEAAACGAVEEEFVWE